MRNFHIGFKDFFSKRAKEESFSFFWIWILIAPFYLVLLFVLTEYIGIYYIFSALISAIICSSANFFLNKTITFRERIGKDFSSEFFIFWWIVLISGFTRLVLLFFLTEFFGIHYIVSSILSLIVSGFVVFIGYKIFIFGK
jgi:putative flippase GtrA